MPNTNPTSLEIRIAADRIQINNARQVIIANAEMYADLLEDDPQHESALRAIDNTTIIAALNIATSRKRQDDRRKYGR